MKNLVLLSVLFLGACTSAIKDEKSEKENPALDAMEVVEEFRPNPTSNLTAKDREDMIGYWVGWFVADLADSTKRRYYKDGIEFSARNKINISIDSIYEDQVYGHSVVANNYQTFIGTVDLRSGIYTFTLKEPMKGKHDGQFLFQIEKGDSVIKGYWEAYGDLPVKRRKYYLKKAIFKYNPRNEITGGSVDWTKTRIHREDTISYSELVQQYGTVIAAIEDYYDIEDIDTNQLDMYVENLLSDLNSYREQVATTSEYLTKFNASDSVLTIAEIENLSRMDIYYIRNSIYARHGYSFRNKELRSFFDGEEWYIPVHANIKSDLTDIEKQNIKLLLAYEEHAEEYYDEFGR